MKRKIAAVLAVVAVLVAAGGLATQAQAKPTPARSWDW